MNDADPGGVMMVTTKSLAPSLANAALLALIALPMALASVTPAGAQTIIDQWTSVKTPPPPALKPVTVDPKTTALLMLDFMNQNCGKRPACLASIPPVKKLLGEARAAKASVVYSIIGNSTTKDVIKDVAPEQGEPYVQAGPDKFLRTDLEKILKDKGIQTVIVTGTASNGAVLFTGAGAAMRGFKVIVPVDGMSAAEPYTDLTTAYTFATAPLVSTKSTLTRTDMIKF
jgi:nicotinamidase-related amidase